MNFRLIGIAALSLMLASPAMAAQGHHHHRMHRQLSVQQAPRVGYGRPYEAYGFDRGDDFAPGNSSGDFERRNTFN